MLKRESIIIFKQCSSLKNQTFQGEACTLTSDEATLQVWLNAEHLLQLQSQHAVTGGVKSIPMSTLLCFQQMNLPKLFGTELYAVQSLLS